MAETLEQEARRLLADVPKEYMFKSSSGHSLCNLKELGDELTTMSDENYVFHANAKKNDFINWIRDVIKDEKLANDLKKAMNHAHAARLVTSRIAALYKRLA